jgi:exonuclease SbcD
MARFLHTADLHLGRILHGERLLDDQVHMLNELLNLIDAQKPDALLIAGDVFDRSVPPSEAVEVLDDFLVAVCKERAVPVVLIPGNHDSADRLGFGSRLLGDKLHIVSTLDRCATPLTLSDAHGDIEVFGLPFLEPSRVRSWSQDEEVRDHQSATETMVKHIRGAQQAPRAVLLAHAFVTGGAVSDSERSISIGGAETVNAATFDGFQYVALGHLHRPQTAGADHIQYAGSPLKYSASEVDYPKSFTQIDIDGAGAVDIVRHPVNALRDLVIIEGSLEEILNGDHPAKPTDLVIARLTDKGPVHNAMGRLRSRWPNALHVERLHPDHGQLTPLSGIDHRTKSTTELFHTFFESVTGEALSPAEADALQAVVGSLNESEGAA